MVNNNMEYTVEYKQSVIQFLKLDYLPNSINHLPFSRVYRKYGKCRPTLNEMCAFLRITNEQINQEKECIKDLKRHSADVAKRRLISNVFKALSSIECPVNNSK